MNSDVVLGMLLMLVAYIAGVLTMGGLFFSIVWIPTRKKMKLEKEASKEVNIRSILN